MAHNGLTLLTTKYVDFSTASTTNVTAPAGPGAGAVTGTGTSIPAPDFVSAETNAEETIITATFNKAMAPLPAAPAGFTVTTGVNFAILDEDEGCCGETVRRMGNELLY
jgi:hypothetical protein